MIKVTPTSICMMQIYAKYIYAIAKKKLKSQLSISTTTTEVWFFSHIILYFSGVSWQQLTLTPASKIQIWNPLEHYDRKCAVIIL